MNKSVKYIIYLCAAAMLLFSSCGDDDEDEIQKEETGSAQKNQHCGVVMMKFRDKDFTNFYAYNSVFEAYSSGDNYFQFILSSDTGSEGKWLWGVYYPDDYGYILEFISTGQMQIGDDLENLKFLFHQSWHAINDEESFRLHTEYSGRAFVKQKTATSITIGFENFSFERYDKYNSEITINGEVTFPVEE